MMRSARSLVAIIAVMAVLTGCGISFPADPEGSLDAARGGVLRVGVSPSPPWTDIGAESEPRGSEVDLIQGFADRIDADIEWTVAGEEGLVEAMDHGELDVIIGGLTARSPWVDRVAVTGPYDSSTDDYGTRHEHVMAVRMGENALLVELEDHLQHRDGTR